MHELSKSATAELLHGYGEIVSLIGDKDLAERFDSAGSGFSNPMTPDPRLGEICRLLKSIVNSGPAVKENETGQNPEAVIHNIQGLPCENAGSAGKGSGENVGSATRDSEVQANWIEEEKRLRSIPKTPERPQKTVTLAVLGSCSNSNEGKSVEGELDNKRRQLLSMWDHERANSLPNAISEARVLVTLAGTYAGVGSSVPFEIRRLRLAFW